MDICTATGDQERPTIVSDGASGATVSRYDSRGADADIFAQKVVHHGSWEDLAPKIISIQDVPGGQGAWARVRFSRSSLDTWDEAARGHNLVVWDGTDNNGRPVPTGVYFYQLKGGSFTSHRKMLVVN